MKDDMVSDDTALIKRAKASFLKHLGSEVLMAKALEEIAVFADSHGVPTLTSISSEMSL